MSFEVRAIKESEREECLALWCTVWPGDNSESYFRRYFYGDVDWLPYYTRVGALDGRLVSAVQICKRIVACGEYRLTMGGVANVATLPEHRGHGYNTLCLRSAIAVMEADAMDFSLLFTGINGYYAREGYVTLPRRGLSGPIRPDYAPVGGDYTVRPADPDDIAAIYAIYNAYNAARPLAVQRTPAYWRDWIGISADQLPTDLLVATDRVGAVRGYVQSGTFRSARPYSAEDDGVRVIELGVERPGDEAGVTRALLAAVTVRSLEAGRRSLGLDLGLEPAIDDALSAILLERHEHINQSGMVRLLHKDNLLRAFTMQWNDRWIAAGRPTGQLDFATPYGSVRINARGEFLRVETIEARGECLSQATLFGLIFGQLTPEQATENAELYPLLSALYTKSAGTYYGSDGF